MDKLTMTEGNIYLVSVCGHCSLRENAEIQLGCMNKTIVDDVPKSLQALLDILALFLSKSKGGVRCRPSFCFLCKRP